MRVRSRADVLRHHTVPRQCCPRQCCPRQDSNLRRTGLGNRRTPPTYAPPGVSSPHQFGWPRLQLTLIDASLFPRCSPAELMSAATRRTAAAGRRRGRPTGFRRRPRPAWACCSVTYWRRVLVPNQSHAPCLSFPGRVLDLPEAKPRVDRAGDCWPCATDSRCTAVEAQRVDLGGGTEHDQDGLGLEPSIGSRVGQEHAGAAGPDGEQ